MPWNIRGKIACHYPARGNPNLDVAAIGFVPAGNNQSGNDIKNIKAVYFVPAGIDPSTVTTNNLHNYLVWERYWTTARELQMDSNAELLLQYIPDTTEAVSSIGIFTTSSDSDNRTLFILNDDGTIIGKAQSEAQTSTTIHSLSAIKRTITFDNPITLIAGKTYWIQYYFNNFSNAPDAYYINESCTVKFPLYKKLSLQSYTGSLAIPELTGCKYLGPESSSDMADYIAYLINLNAYDAFKANHSYATYNPNRVWADNNYIYKKNDINIGTFNNYISKTGNSYDYTSGVGKVMPSLSNIQSLTLNNIGVFYCQENGVDCVDIIKRIGNIPTAYVTDKHFDNIGSESDKTEFWKLLQSCPLNESISFDAQYYVYNITDNIIVNRHTQYVRTNKGTFGYSSSSDYVDRSTITSPVEGTAYMVIDNGNKGTEIYINGSWQRFDPSAEYTDSNNNKIQFFTVLNIYDLIEYKTDDFYNNGITKLSTNQTPVIVSGITSAETRQDKHHYLEINGNEVT